jgi:hypothetical protein
LGVEIKVTTMTVRPLPLPPLHAGAAAEMRQTMTRAATARLLAYGRGPVEAVVADIYGRERNADVIVKAAVSPHSLANTSALAPVQGLAVISAMGPASGGAPLCGTGITFIFNNSAGIYLGNILAAAASGGGFTKEGDPIAVRQFVLDNTTLVPKRMKVIVVVSREITTHSVPTIETMIQTAIADSFALQFDTVLLSTNTADDATPAGLRQGIAAQTASTSTLRAEAMMADLETLIGAVASIAGNGAIALIMSPSKAVALRLAVKASPFPYPIYASSGLASGIVCAVACNSLVSAFDAMPSIEVGDQASLHMDTGPTQLSIAGTPNAVAAPIRSLYQTDSLGLKFEFQANWALRNAAGLAWLTTAAW